MSNSVKTSPGPFQLREDELISQAMRRIVVHQLDKAIAGLTGQVDKPLEELVHEARKRLKRVRAALRVIRGSLGQKRQQREDRRIRDAGRLLSEARDAAVLLQTLDRLAEQTENDEQALALRAFRAEFEERVRAIEHQESLIQDQFPAVVALLRQTRRTLRNWTVDVEEEGWPVVSQGVNWIYKRGRKTYRAAEQEPSVENLHEWRKRVKDLWHLFEIVQPIRPSSTQQRLDQAHQLADWLGDDHDLAMLQERLEQPESNHVTPAHVATALPLIEQRRQALQASAFPLGATLYQERPKAFQRRLEAYWRAWRSELEAARFDEGDVKPECPTRECEP